MSSVVLSPLSHWRVDIVSGEGGWGGEYVEGEMKMIRYKITNIVVPD